MKHLKYGNDKSSKSNNKKLTKSIARKIKKGISNGHWKAGSGLFKSPIEKYLGENYALYSKI